MSQGEEVAGMVRKGPTLLKDLKSPSPGPFFQAPPIAVSAFASTDQYPAHCQACIIGSTVAQEYAVCKNSITNQHGWSCDLDLTAAKIWTMVKVAYAMPGVACGRRIQVARVDRIAGESL